MKHKENSRIDRVLIVEDDPISGMVLRRALENRGYSVAAVENGEQALEAMSRESFRIVISDWMMPRMDGLDLCRRIRESKGSHYTYFILLTAKSQKEDRSEGLLAGVDDYLVKPLDTAELDGRLRVATRILDMHEELYRHALAVRKTKNGVVTVLADGNVEWANESFCEMASLEIERAVGWPLRRVLEEAGIESDCVDECQAGLNSGTGFSVEAIVNAGGAHRRWLALDGTPIREDGGEVSLFVMVVTDVTERKEQQEQIRRQFERITALRAIDIAINFGRDLGLTLAILLDQIPPHVGADAAAILELDESSGDLVYTAGRGFRSDAAANRRLKVGEGCAGAVAQSKMPLTAGRIGSENDFVEAAGMQQEGFQSWAGIPMISRGELVGVLEIYHRSPLVPDPDQQEFLAAVASQAAIAIANARLLAELQHSNEELCNAYDSTIEGWSRALDLRDQETEGHSQRVTELTVQLARAMGFTDDELVHIRRGALLHDIGKMGVPDAILLKPGPLCQEEWELMRRHPLYALEMLSPIQFLDPALDIPYCHHEKWDGSGYPRGLKGVEIPLSARIFAVVDVWDALRSDRPYRKAWETAEVCDHIRSLSGTHFDPAVVEVFLSIVVGEANLSHLQDAA